MAWNRADTSSQSAARKPASKSPSAVKGAIAGVVVVALAVAAYFLLFSNGPEKPKTEKVEKKPAKIVEVKPAAAATNKVDVAKTDSAADDEARRIRREKLKAMSPEQRLEYLAEQAKKHPLPEAPSSNRIFRTAVEQAMEMIFSREVGDMPPPLPKLSISDRVHLADILVSDNPVSDSDSERAKIAKETVQLAKAEFRKFIKDGGDPEEFLPYYHSQLVHAHDEYKAAHRAMIDTIRNDPDIAPEFIKKVNEGLAAKGIKKVVLPSRMLEHFNVQLDD